MTDRVHATASTRRDLPPPPACGGEGWGGAQSRSAPSWKADRAPLTGPRFHTPPVGSVQFVACAIGRVSFGESMRTIWPFYGASVAVLLLVTYVPAISLWLPRVFH